MEVSLHFRGISPKALKGDGDGGWMASLQPALHTLQREKEVQGLLLPHIQESLKERLEAVN